MGTKRYNIVNKYIRGSNVSPQTSHALNNLWKKSIREMNDKERFLFEDWCFNSEVEIDLQGGGHSTLESLYEKLTGMKDTPCSKFNESEEALNGACTVVSFIASKEMVAVNDYIRTNNKDPFEIDSIYENMKTVFGVEIKYEDVEIACYISTLRTVS